MLNWDIIFNAISLKARTVLYQFYINNLMKRGYHGGLRGPKRPKVQMSIQSMLLKDGPKFTESVGLQPTCRYCGRMFKGAQGLSAHIFMHQRAGLIFLSREIAVFTELEKLWARNEASKKKSPTPLGPFPRYPCTDVQYDIGTVGCL